MANDKEFECITCSQLVTRIAARQMRMSRADVKMSVHILLDHMSEVLSRGERIEVRGFGSFSVRFRKPRMTRNPKTHKTVFITGRTLPCFKSSALLLDRVNKRPRGYTLLDPGYPEEQRVPAGAEIVPPIEDMPQEAPAQADAGAQTDAGAQGNAGAQADAGAQANAGAQTDAGAHADTYTGAPPAAMNAEADAARGGDEGRDDAAPPPERDSGAV